MVSVSIQGHVAKCIEVDPLCDFFISNQWMLKVKDKNQMMRLISNSMIRVKLVI